MKPAADPHEEYKLRFQWANYRCGTCGRVRDIATEAEAVESVTCGLPQADKSACAGTAYKLAE